MRFLCISGSRDIQPGSKQWSRVESLVEAQLDSTIIVTGDCPTGADDAARQAAKRSQRDHFEFRARWRKQGNAGGPKRNKRMMKFLEDMMVFEDTVIEVHCFFQQGSKNAGTTSAFNWATKFNLRVVRHD